MIIPANCMHSFEAIWTISNINKQYLNVIQQQYKKHYLNSLTSY